MPKVVLCGLWKFYTWEQTSFLNKVGQAHSPPQVPPFPFLHTQVCIGVHTPPQCLIPNILHLTVWIWTCRWVGITALSRGSAFPYTVHLASLCPWSSRWHRHTGSKKVAILQSASLASTRTAVKEGLEPFCASRMVALGGD